MNVHFQTPLFQEIIHGIATSCEGYLLEATDMIKAAAEIYVSLHKAEEEAEKGETEVDTEWTEGECKYKRISECRNCKQRMIRFPADGVQFCSGCGKKIIQKGERNER